MTIAVDRWAATWRAAIDEALAESLDTRLLGAPAELAEAMRYAALSGGKRLRPLLVLATAGALGAREPVAIPAGVAIELIHAYSLVHDDLPVMDDDELRRGRPTVHVRFGEAPAVLAGDALQSLAFEVLARNDALGAACIARQVAVLASAAGAAGMAGGQALDLAAEGAAAGPLETSDVEKIHSLKTGALIGASLRLGAEAADAAPESAEELYEIGCLVGLAFQIHDDLLDRTATTGSLGKTAGKDAAAGKATWPAAGGITGARDRASGLVRSALERLAVLGLSGGPLEAMVRRAVDRDR